MEVAESEPYISCAATETPTQEQPLSFGETFTFPDGLTVSLAPPERLVEFPEVLILTFVVTNATDMPLVKQDDLALAFHTSVDGDGAEPVGQLPSGDYRSFPPVLLPGEVGLADLHYRIPVGSTIRAAWITSDGLTAVFGGLAPA